MNITNKHLFIFIIFALLTGCLFHAIFTPVWTKVSCKSIDYGNGLRSIPSFDSNSIRSANKPIEAGCTFTSNSIIRNEYEKFFGKN